MTPLPLSLLAHWAEGELHGVDVMVGGVSNDTRKLQAGDLYLALRGERFDGHDFAEDAVARGASALLVDHRLEHLGVPQIVVANTELALARIAHRMQQERRAKVVAITGSNGKTSVKALTLSILERAGHTSFNPGNHNNEIGLPLAVIDAPEDADFAIYEMGAGKPGDIAYLTAIVAPDVAVVNNVAPAHLERMGSLLGVAQTKGAIYSDLRAGGIAVINADDAFAEYFVGLAAGKQVIRYGIDNGGDVTARHINARAEGSDFVLVTPRGEVKITLNLPGRHNVMNALAAASLALGAGVALEVVVAGLQAARPVAGRQVAQLLDNGATLVDDSYNANPGSLAAAIDTLAATHADTWLVLGDMRELGPDAAALHAEAGRRAKAAGIRRLYALGALSEQAAHAFGEGGRVFDSHEALANTLLHALADNPAPRNVRLLVKGSRGSAMDRVVKALLAAQKNSNNNANTTTGGEP